MRRALSLYRARFGLYVALVAIPVVPVGLAIVALAAAAPNPGASLQRITYIDFAAEFLLVNPLCQAMVAFAVVEQLAGRTPALPTTLRAVLPHWSALVGTVILSVLAIVLGVFALVIPGVIMAIWFQFVGQVVILEHGTYLDALQTLSRARARRLVAHVRIAIAIGLVGAAASVLLTAVLTGVLQPQDASDRSKLVAPLIANIPTSVLVLPFSTIALTLVYLRLRRPAEARRVSVPPPDLPFASLRTRSLAGLIDLALTLAVVVPLGLLLGQSGVILGVLLVIALFSYLEARFGPDAGQGDHGHPRAAARRTAGDDARLDRAQRVPRDRRVPGHLPDRVHLDRGLEAQAAARRSGGRHERLRQSARGRRAHAYPHGRWRSRNRVASDDCRNREPRPARLGRRVAGAAGARRCRVVRRLRRRATAPRGHPRHRRRVHRARRDADGPTRSSHAPTRATSHGSRSAPTSRASTTRARRTTGASPRPCAPSCASVSAARCAAARCTWCPSRWDRSAPRRRRSACS